MTIILTIKQGDTHNALNEQLIKDGKPINLTDCQVYITVFGVIENGECTIVDAEDGRVVYPLSNLSHKSGYFRYDFEIRYADGTVEFVPNDSDNKIRVYKRSVD